MAEHRDNPKDVEKARRAERLAAALRENLRRRKSQARGRTQSDSKAYSEPDPEQDR